MDNNFLYHVENIIVQQMNILRLDFKEEMKSLWTKLAPLMKDKATDCSFNQDTVLECTFNQDTVLEGSFNQDTVLEGSFNQDTVIEAGEENTKMHRNNFQNPKQLIDFEPTKTLVPFKETDLNNDAQTHCGLDDTEPFSVSNSRVSDVAENVIPWYQTIKVELCDDCLTDNEAKTSSETTNGEAFSLQEMYVRNEAKASSIIDSTRSSYNIDPISVINSDVCDLRSSESTTTAKKKKSIKRYKHSNFPKSKLTDFQKRLPACVIKCEDGENQVSVWRKKQTELLPSLNGIETMQNASDASAELALYNHYNTVSNQNLTKCLEFKPTYQEKKSFNENSALPSCFHQASVPYDKMKHVAKSLKVSKVKSLSGALQSGSAKQCTKLKKQKGSNRFLKDFQVFRCQVCSKRFSSKHGLLCHLNAHNRKKFSCHFCKKIFTYKLSFYHHLQTHRKIHFSCEICDKVFVDEVALQTHHNNHTHSPFKDKKPHPQKYKSQSHSSVVYNNCHNTCELCDKTFPTKLKLLSHMKIHVMKTRSEINRKLRYNLRKVNI